MSDLIAEIVNRAIDAVLGPNLVMCPVCNDKCPAWQLQTCEDCGTTGCDSCWEVRMCCAKGKAA